MGPGVPDLADLLRGMRSEGEAWTAVESFSKWNDAGHAQAKHYQGLVPLSAPRPEERYAFEVDLDRCTSCKACVTACHSLNGLDESESWRNVGVLQDTGSGRQVVVTSSCHHCEDPACANGCPTLSYEKLENGVVKHLDDQCMGCRYCEWTCPYGAPQWNESRGIVRKCDLCHERLAAGEAPACVQACPNGAIAVRLVSIRAGTMDLPGVVDPSHTGPSTRYITSSPLSDRMRPGNEGFPVLEDDHAPLAFLLVATQWAVGASVFASLVLQSGILLPPALGPTIFVLFALGMVLGSSHLGRPTRAWKAFLGWRRSWFSREVLLFGATLPVLGLWAFRPWIPLSLPDARWLATAAASIGLAGVGASFMIYRVTRRATWARSATAWRFALTVFGGGAVLLGTVHSPWIRWFGIVSILSGLAKAVLVRSDSRAFPKTHPLAAQSLLLQGPLAGRMRLQAALFGAAMVSALAGTYLAMPLLFWAAAVLRFASDIVERELFFQTATPARMPGFPLG